MFYPHPRHQLNLCEPVWKWLPQSSKTRYEVVMWGRFYSFLFFEGNIYRVWYFIGCNSADAGLTQGLNASLLTTLQKTRSHILLSEQWGLCLPKQHSPTFQSFLTFFLLVITFAIHASGIMEIYSKSLGEKKNLLIFPELGWQAIFPFSFAG